MAAEREPGLDVVFFGAMSLLAREVRRHFEATALPVRAMHLFDAAGLEGTVTEYAGEAMLVTLPDEDVAGRADLALVCGEDDPRSGAYLDWATRGSGIAVDLVGASRKRAGVPVVNCDVNPGAVAAAGRILAVPHAIAHPLSTILHRLSGAFGLLEASATVLRPVSDLGEPGVEELHHQTVALLNFASVPTEVFGRQVAFNVVPVAVQGEAGAALEETVIDDVARVLGSRDLPLSVRIVQAPVFHGHAYSIRAACERAPGPGEIEEALRVPGVISISRGDDGRTPVELAEETGIWIGDVTIEARRPEAFWIWAVTDALRSGAALNAARLAERAVGIRA